MKVKVVSRQCVEGMDCKGMLMWRYLVDKGQPACQSPLIKVNGGSQGIMGRTPLINCQMT